MMRLRCRSAELLSLVGPVGDAALLERADCLRQEVAQLGLVEAGRAAPPERWAFDPVEHEQRLFDTADLAQCEVKLVLHR